MKKEPNSPRSAHSKSDKTEANDFPGYPVYPPSEDIYSKSKEEENIDPEDLLQGKSTFAPDEFALKNEKDFKDDVAGDDLDVPGSELDEQQEMPGTEDEENEYYSLGGDEHNDLEEDRGGID